MCRFSFFMTVCLVLGLTANSFGADVILNEYNAVDTTLFLGGGTVSLDDSGTRASDSYFGRVPGNGGDWFELVVITDHLDMRNWKLDIYIEGALDNTLNLTNHSIWSDLRSGTIITVSEDIPSDISYDPAAGDWWINVQAKNGADGFYIEASNFPVNDKNWQLRIRNSAGAVIFGPAGEGVSPADGISVSEIFRLEANPNASITPTSKDYDSGDKLSTFGSPNQWGQQDMFALRSVINGTSSLTLLSPNGSEKIAGGTMYDIKWHTSGAIGNVLIEYSINNGTSWLAVNPQNVGNTGSYGWLVPTATSSQCLVRVKNAANFAVFDVSNATFTIQESTLTLLNPNGSQILAGGSDYNITWSSAGTVSSMDIELSIDGGDTWSKVYPHNVGNAGSYHWLVPNVNSQLCLIRIINTDNSAVSDTSAAFFTIYECVVDGDVTGDCFVNLTDLAVMASFWLDCGNPYNLDCL
jgi:hypothetical protein